MDNVFELYLQDITADIRDEIISAYRTDPNLFLAYIDMGGFPVNQLNQNDAFVVVIHRFISLCKLLNLQQLYQLFNTLYENAPGLIPILKSNERLNCKSEVRNQKSEVINTNAFSK